MGRLGWSNAAQLVPAGWGRSQSIPAGLGVIILGAEPVLCAQSHGVTSSRRKGLGEAPWGAEPAGLRLQKQVGKHKHLPEHPRALQTSCESAGDKRGTGGGCPGGAAGIAVAPPASVVAPPRAAAPRHHHGR